MTRHPVEPRLRALGVVGVLALSSACPGQDRRERFQRVQMEAFSNAIHLFKQERHRCPASVHELVPGYLREAQPDLWNQPVRLSSSDGKCTVRSAGRDGTFETADDFVSSVP